ncbi:MAG: hypothetical protein ACREN5_10940, partial [Gemmatimonadales bacterium]
MTTWITYRHRARPRLYRPPSNQVAIPPFGGRWEADVHGGWRAAGGGMSRPPSSLRPSTVTA